MSVPQARRALRRTDRVLGDVQAIRTGRVVARMTNRLIGRALGRLTRRLWR